LLDKNFFAFVNFLHGIKKAMSFKTHGFLLIISLTI